MMESETVTLASPPLENGEMSEQNTDARKVSQPEKKTIDDPSALMRVLMDQNVSGALSLFRDPEWPSQDLTKREHVVLLGIAHGLSNSNIGDGVRISQRTVEIHRKNLIRKLGAINSADAVRIAVKLGMI